MLNKGDELPQIKFNSKLYRLKDQEARVQTLHLKKGNMRVGYLDRHDRKMSIDIPNDDFFESHCIIERHYFLDIYNDYTREEVEKYCSLAVVKAWEIGEKLANEA